jgi:CubicO group peptidase (beta-lactamase class C family)
MRRTEDRPLPWNASRRRRARHAAIGVLLLGGQAAAGAVHAQHADALRGLESYIERAREDWGVAGLALAIVRGDTVIFARGFGTRESGTAAPVDANTLFAIGSNTKAFTAAGVGLLVEEGRMSWDDPVTKHLPEFQLHDPYVTREMTIRDLLSHRSGLGRRGDMIWYATPFDRAEVIRRVRHLEPNSSFRSTYGYQNIMFISAGEALARVAGVSWDDFMRTRLLEPLGMRRSNTSVTQLAGTDNVATPHTKRAGATVPIAWRNIDNAGPAGSINSSVADMAQWLRMLLAGGELDGRRILARGIVRELQQPHTITGTGTDTIFPMTHFSLYGLGFGLRDYYGRRLVLHTGGIDGMLSNVALLPGERIGVVILTNTDGQSLGTVLMYHIIDALIDAPARDWNAVFLRLDEQGRRRAEAAQSALLAARIPDTQPSLPLERYAGTYDNEMYGPVVVSHDDGALRLRRLDTLGAELEHWHFDTFRATWSDPGLGTAMVSFALDEAGRVRSLELAGIGEFRRVEPTARDH